MPRLVAHRKFWHAWVDGSKLTVRFGPAGTSGQKQVKSFASRDAAEKELAKLVKQKIAKGYEDGAWSCDFDSGLACRAIVDPPLPVPVDASLAHEEAGLKDESWSETFWHGDDVFALEKTRAGYVAGVIQRRGDACVWRRIKPAIEGEMFPYGFDDDRQRLIVATPKGAAFIVDCKTAAATEVAPAGDEITAAALGRDFAAALRKAGKKVRLELYDLRTRKLTHTIRCNRQNALLAFGGGRGLMVTWEQNDESWDGENWPNTHFLNVDGGVRLLGSFGLSLSYGYSLDGRSYFNNDTQGLIEICNLDDAVRNTAKASPPTTLD